MTKSEFNNTIAQRLVVSLSGSMEFGEVTKYTETEFSVLWTGETHSGNYSHTELKKKADGSLWVDEKRVIRPEE